MKRFVLLSSLLVVCSLVLQAEKSSVITDILNEYVIRKVDDMQQNIRFSDTQAAQLKKVELDYLLEVQKTENCRCCNSVKRIKKAAEKKDQELQNTLTREQYLKYVAIEKNRVKKHPLRAAEK